MKASTQLTLFLTGFALIMLAAIACHGQAVYYIATNGASGNNGTSTNTPWNLAKLNYNESIPSNSIIYVLPGIYEETNAQNTTTGPNLYCNYCTVKSLVKWGAILNDSGDYGFLISTNNVTIDGFVVNNAFKNGIFGAGSGTTSNLVVQNCWIEYCGTNPASGIGPSGIVNTFADGQVLQYNLIEHIGNVTYSIYDHGIYVAGNNLKINNNVIRYCAGAGIQLNDHAAGSYGSSNVMIFNNLVYSNGNWGMYLSSDYSNNVSTTIYNNTLFDNGTISATDGGQGGIALALEAHPPGTNFLYATNNILIDTFQTTKIGVNVNVGATNCDYNIIALQDNFPIGAHGILTNQAGFVNPGNGLFWLKNTSVARGKAFSGVFPSTNFFGIAQTNSVDIGAFQYNLPYALDNRTMDPSPQNPNYWFVLFLSPPRSYLWIY